MAVDANNANFLRLIPPLNDAGPVAESAEQRHLMPIPGIWVGFIKRGRSFLDTTPQMPDTEQQIKALQEYHQQKFTPFERFIRKWIFCQHPIVLIGELYGDQSNDLEGQYFPREVQFERLQKSQVLTKGFLRPQSLRENTRFFHQRSYFNVRSLNHLNVRKVLCVGYEVKRANLIGPLLVSLCFSFVTAAVAAVVTQSISTGVGIGGTVEATLVLVWSYTMWYLK